MEMLNNIKNLLKHYILKSEIGGSKTGEKLVASALILFLTLQAHNQAKAEDSVQQLEPITAAMDISEGNFWNQSLIAQYENILHPENKNKYKYLGLPNPIGLSGDASLPENANMLKNFNVKFIPAWVLEGITHDYTQATAGFQLIPEAIKNTPQLADFSLTKSEKKGQYTLEITGKDELKKYKNIGLNVIAFQENVNCSATDAFRTTILERVAKQYIFGTGIGVTLGKDMKFSKNIFFNIPESIQPNTIIVAYLFDKTNNKFLASAFTEMVEGEHAIFKVDNSLPKCTVDLKDIEKYTSLDDLAMKLPNLPEYTDKTGYMKKTFGGEKIKDLVSLSFEFDYTSLEANIYDFLTVGLPKELEGKATLKFDKKTKKVELQFLPGKEYTGSGELLNYYFKVNEPTINGTKYTDGTIINSVNNKIKNLIATDSKGNSLKYDIAGEPKNVFPVRMCVVENPLDFNHDTWLNQKDWEEFLSHFGEKVGDKTYDKKFDIVPDDRIDIRDMLEMHKALDEQEKLAKEINTISPGIVPAENLPKPEELDIQHSPNLLECK